MNSLTREALAALAEIQRRTNLHLDPVGLDAQPPVLTVMRGGATDCAAVCTLDPDNYPPGIGKRLQPHYDALCLWAEARGLFSDVKA